MRTSSPAHLWLPLLVILLTAAVYIPTLRYQFVMDDTEQVIDNQARLNWQFLPSYFSRDVWDYVSITKSNYYRPVFMTWLMLVSQFADTDPMLWHLSTMLLHLLATFLVYLLAQKLLGDAVLAAIAALIFGVHPAHVESVAWVSGATDPLFAVLALGALLMHIRAREDSAARKQVLWRLGSIACFGLALFAKETAVIVPALLFAYEWFFSDASSRKVRLRGAARTVAPYLIPIALYVPMRWYALGSLEPTSFGWRVSSWIATCPLALSFYLRHLFWPFPNSIFYPLRPVDSWSTQQVLAPLLATSVAGLAIYILTRRSRVAAFGAVLLALPVLPLLDLRALPKGDFVHDRYLYLPVAGLGILAVMALRRLPQHRLILLAAAGAVALCTLKASTIWQDKSTLYTQALRVAPDSYRAKELLGTELMQQRQFADALVLFKQALATEQNELVLYLNIANCYNQLGEADKAADYLQDAVLVAPKNPSAFSVLAFFNWAATMRMRRRRPSAKRCGCGQGRARRTPGTI